MKSSKLALLIVFMTLLVIPAIFTSSAVATHDSGAYNGPVYDWLFGNTEYEYSHVDVQSYDLQRSYTELFSGGLIDEDALYIMRMKQKIEYEGNDINSIEDLDDDKKERLKEAFKEVNKNSQKGNFGSYMDRSYDQNPQEDITQWNSRTLYNWQGFDEEVDAEGSLAPEHRILETESMHGAPVNAGANTDDVTWGDGIHVSIYSNDPSTWIHYERNRNRGDGNGTDQLIDDSQYLVADHGTVRFVYDGYIAYKPKGKAPDNPVGGDTRTTYTNGTLRLENADVYVEGYRRDDTCYSRCKLNTSTINVNDGIGVIYWEIPEDSEAANLGGKISELVLEGEFTITYDKKIEEAKRVCVKRSDDSNTDDGSTDGGSTDDGSSTNDGPEKERTKVVAKGASTAVYFQTQENPDGSGGSSDCEEYEIQWETTEVVTDDVVRTKTVEDSRTVTFSSMYGVFSKDSQVTVEKAEYPDGTYEYRVDIEGSTSPNRIEPWSTIEIGKYRQASSSWAYFSSRSKRWDDIHEIHNESKEDVRDRLEEVYVEEKAYPSPSRPLEVHAFPKYKYYNTLDSSGLVHPKNHKFDHNLDVEQHKRYSPALELHSSCQQNWPHSEGRNGENAEPCYWMITASGQGIHPPQMYRYAHYGVTTEDEYEEYIEETSNEEILFEKTAWDEPDWVQWAYTLFANQGYGPEEREDHLYDGTYYESEQTVIQTQKNFDEVTVNSIIHEEQRTDQVDETIQVKDAQLTGEIVYRCVDPKEGSQSGPIVERPGDHPEIGDCQPPNMYDDTAADWIVVRLYLFHEDEDGNRTYINTSERGRDDTIIVQNGHRTRQDGEWKYSNRTVETTPEKSFVYVKVYNSNEEKGIPIDIEYQSRHWTDIESGGDDIQPYTDAEFKKQTQTGKDYGMWKDLFLFLSAISVLVVGMRKFFDTMNLNLRLVGDSLLDHVPNYLMPLIIIGGIVYIVYAPFSRVYFILSVVLFFYVFVFGRYPLGPNR